LLGQLPGWSGTTPPGQAAAAQELPPGHQDPSAGGAGSPPGDYQSGPATIPIRPLDESTTHAQAALAASSEGHSPGLLNLAIDRIQHNPHQPRQEFDPDELQRLADSITSHGLLQPIAVRLWEGGYQLIAGERRLRAARLAGWSEVPATIVEADDRQTALEKAACFQRYLDQYGGTQEELAGRLDLDRSTIANLIRLLELPGSVQDALRRGKITPGHARALLPLGEEREQATFCERIQKEGLNVRQTESMVQEAIAAADGCPVGVVGADGAVTKPPRRGSEHVAALEQEFRTALGMRVNITHDTRGRGKVVIAFGSHEEFDQIRQHICDGGRAVRKGQAG
jgi:ParB family chromosome partitioning protein